MPCGTAMRCTAGPRRGRPAAHYHPGLTPVWVVGGACAFVRVRSCVCGGGAGFLQAVGVSGTGVARHCSARTIAPPRGWRAACPPWADRPPPPPHPPHTHSPTPTTSPSTQLGDGHANTASATLWGTHPIVMHAPSPWKRALPFLWHYSNPSCMRKACACMPMEAHLVDGNGHGEDNEDSPDEPGCRQLAKYWVMMMTMTTISRRGKPWC